MIPTKSVFNKIIGDNPFELEVASYLESRFDDVISFAKNTLGEGGVNFKIEYQAEDGNIHEYNPDFFVRTAGNTFYILETKGREDLDDLRKIKRLVQWCDDVNQTQETNTYHPVYIKQDKWDTVKKDLHTFSDLYQLFEAK